MNRSSSWLPWLLALLLTMLLAVYQRLTGPTYPVRGKELLPHGEIRFDFNRSGTSHQSLPVRVVAAGSGLEFRLHYRRFPFQENEAWTASPMEKKGFSYQALIPGQPVAGKVAYKVEVLGAGGSAWLNRGEFVVARFKGEVPASLLILHIILMFAGLLLAFRTGLGALFRDAAWQRLIPWTLAVTFLGGMVLGPLVQKYAFGSYWTGFPLGSDLTDSKTLFAVLFWFGAFLLRRRSRWWTAGATALMLVVYLIPHSVLGSELDYKTGKVETAEMARE